MKFVIKSYTALRLVMGWMLPLRYACTFSNCKYP